MSILCPALLGNPRDLRQSSDPSVCSIAAKDLFSAGAQRTMGASGGLQVPSAHQPIQTQSFQARSFSAIWLSRRFMRSACSLGKVVGSYGISRSCKPGILKWRVGPTKSECEVGASAATQLWSVSSMRCLYLCMHVIRE